MKLHSHLPHLYILLKSTVYVTSCPGAWPYSPPLWTTVSASEVTTLRRYTNVIITIIRHPWAVVGVVNVSSWNSFASAIKLYSTKRDFLQL